MHKAINGNTGALLRPIHGCGYCLHLSDLFFTFSKELIIPKTIFIIINNHIHG